MCFINVVRVWFCTDDLDGKLHNLTVQKNLHWSRRTIWTTAPSGMYLKCKQWQFFLLQYGAPSGVIGHNSSAGISSNWLRIGADGRMLEMLLISPAKRRSLRAGSGKIKRQYNEFVLCKGRTWRFQGGEDSFCRLLDMTLRDRIGVTNIRRNISPSSAWKWP